MVRLPLIVLHFNRVQTSIINVIEFTLDQSKMSSEESADVIGQVNLAGSPNNTLIFL